MSERKYDAYWQILPNDDVPVRFAHTEEGKKWLREKRSVEEMVEILEEAKMLPLILDAASGRNDKAFSYFVEDGGHIKNRPSGIDENTMVAALQCTFINGDVCESLLYDGRDMTVGAMECIREICRVFLDTMGCDTMLKVGKLINKSKTFDDANEDDDVQMSPIYDLNDSSFEFEEDDDLDDTYDEYAAYCRYDDFENFDAEDEEYDVDADMVLDKIDFRESWLEDTLREEMWFYYGRE